MWRLDFAPHRRSAHVLSCDNPYFTNTLLIPGNIFGSDRSCYSSNCFLWPRLPVPDVNSCTSVQVRRGITIPLDAGEGKHHIRGALSVSIRAAQDVSQPIFEQKWYGCIYCPRPRQICCLRSYSNVFVSFRSHITPDCFFTAASRNPIAL